VTLSERINPQGLTQFTALDAHFSSASCCTSGGPSHSSEDRKGRSATAHLPQLPCAQQSRRTGSNAAR
jgi:hypothetical protein